jgi:methyltransferase-like protein 6
LRPVIYGQVLAPGGWIFFRDYATGDLAEGRFEERGGKKISENFFVRRDGTRAFYFSKGKICGVTTKRHVENIETIFPEDRYEIVQNEYVTKQVENKKEDLKMARKWIQTKVVKR